MKIKELFETDEIVIGFLIGIGLIFIIGFWAILLGLATGVLYRMGGMGVWQTKAWRRIGVPVLIAGALWNLPLLARIISGLVTFGLLTIGYGTRTLNQDGTLQDEGSPFGNFFLDLAIGLGASVRVAELFAHIMTRSIIVIGIWASWYIVWGMTR